jgi:hypothetical protein
MPREIQKEFMRMRGAGSMSIGIGWENMILAGVEDPCNNLDPRNLGQSK